MKKSNINIIQECIKQLSNEVNIGMGIDMINNTVCTFLSFPKERLSEDLLIKRIELLNKYHTKVSNAIIGYFYTDDRCYLIEEQQNAVVFISDFWDNIASNLSMDSLEIYRDFAMQYIYALAYILNFFNENNLGAALTGYELASYHDQFEPCFTGLGFPEIFGETKSSSDNEQYFKDFCKKINPKLKNIPTIENIINKTTTIEGSPEKREEILRMCLAESEEKNIKKDEENGFEDMFENIFGNYEENGSTKTNDDNKNDYKDNEKTDFKYKFTKNFDEKESTKININNNKDEEDGFEDMFENIYRNCEEKVNNVEKTDPALKYENDNIIITKECIRKLPNKVKIGLGIDQSSNDLYYLISCPENRISKEVISERILLLNQFKTKALNAVIGYFYRNGKCYLIEEQPYITSFIKDFWGDVRDDINKKSNQQNRDIAMQYMYSLAYILKYFNDVGVVAALNGYELASYRNAYEPCFTALGFPEIFNEVKPTSDNEQYFQDFCKEMNPKIKNIPTIDDLVNGKAKIRGSIKKRAEILSVLTGKRVKINKIEEEEEEDVNENEIKANNCMYEFVECEESILTDPCFQKTFYHDEESHIYEMLPLFLTNKSLDFIETGFKDREFKSIQSLGSEFCIGNVCELDCILHKTPNDPISIENENLVLKSINFLSIPYCIHHEKNQFVYMIEKDTKPLIDLNSSSDYYIMMFISFLYNLHQSGFLYLRRDFNNIFYAKNIYICGFDTCMKIGSKKCTSEMIDWDDEPTELTDYICLGAFVYYILTKKELFNGDPQSNKEKFKKGIQIPAKNIGKKKAKMIQSLLSPDPNVRKTIHLLDLIDFYLDDNETVGLSFLGTYYFKPYNYGIIINGYSLESTDYQVFLRGHNPKTDGFMDYRGINVSCEANYLFSSSIILDSNGADFSISGLKKGHFIMNRGRASMTIFLPNGETKVEWDNENGIIVLFPDFKVKMHPDGSLLFPDGKFRKKIENGKLIIKGQGLKITHGGSFLELKSDFFTFKMHNNECWEIKAPLTYAKYTPDEVFMKIADHWLKYSNSRLETGYRGYHALLTDETFQIKNSFMELNKSGEEKCRFRLFNKELIPKKLENIPYQIYFFDIPELETPNVPMQTKNAYQTNDKNNSMKLITAEERAIDKNQNLKINRDWFDEFYLKIKNDNYKFAVPDDIEIQEKLTKPKTKKKKERKNLKQNKNQDQNLSFPLMENISTEDRVHQEELPQDFASTQAINKIRKLLEAGESIAFFTSAKIINFLKPKRIRKIVITSAGRVFFTNIGGDGILGTIQTNKKSHADISGCHVKVHGSKKIFHFVFDSKEDGEKFVEKFSQSIG